jgi:hypothetical protein
LRVLHLHYSLILILLILTAVTPCATEARDEQWTSIGNDYQTFFESIAGYSSWTFNATRGPGNRWGINFTISGFGYHSTTLIVCDESEYQYLIQTSATNHCRFVCSVNNSLDTVVDLPYLSQWYLILNNTGPFTLYFSLQITLYQWTTSTLPTLTNSIADISSLFVYLVLIGLILFVFIPCICRMSSEKQQQRNQTIIVVMTPDQLERYTDDEDK